MGHNIVPVASTRPPVAMPLYISPPLTRTHRRQWVRRAASLRPKSLQLLPPMPIRPDPIVPLSHLAVWRIPLFIGIARTRACT